MTVNNGDAGYTELLAKIKVKTDSTNFASLRIVGYVRAFLLAEAEVLLIDKTKILSRMGGVAVSSFVI